MSHLHQQTATWQIRSGIPVTSRHCLHAAQLTCNSVARKHVLAGAGSDLLAWSYHSLHLLRHMKCPNSLCISLGAYGVTHCSIVPFVLIVFFFAKIERLSRAFVCRQMLSPIGCWCWWGWWCWCWWGGVYFWITHCESWHHFSFFFSFLLLVHEEACECWMLYLMGGCGWAVQHPFIYLFVLISVWRWPHCSMAHPSLTVLGLVRFSVFLLRSDCKPHHWPACWYFCHRLKVLNFPLWGRWQSPVSSLAVQNIRHFQAGQWLKRA